MPYQSLSALRKCEVLLLCREGYCELKCFGQGRVARKRALNHCPAVTATVNRQLLPSEIRQCQALAFIASALEQVEGKEQSERIAKNDLGSTELLPDIQIAIRVLEERGATARIGDQSS
jgi:hypothetical protein